MVTTPLTPPTLRLSKQPYQACERVMNLLGASPLTACKAFVIACMTVMSCAVSSQAALLFDRGLPTHNLNNIAPGNLASNANRSNISWAFADRVGSGYSYPVGDDFLVGKIGQEYIVDTLRVWLVVGVAGTSQTISANFWQTLTLWGGKVESKAAGLKPLHRGPTDGSDPHIEITEVTYSNGDRYWAESVGLYRKIWQLDFRDLNWQVAGGDRYQFFVNGTGFTSLGIWNVFPTLHASGADWSGSSQAEADNFYRLLRLYHDQPEYLGTWNSNWQGPAGTYKENGLPGFGGWNKPSDINVQIYGNLFMPPVRPIPEPTSGISLLLLGLTGLWAYRRTS